MCLNCCASTSLQLLHRMAPSPGTPVGGERSPRSPRRASTAASSAAGPGPMQVDAVGHGRVFCPVPTCPCSDPARAAGWTNDTTRPYKHYTRLPPHLKPSLSKTCMLHHSWRLTPWLRPSVPSPLKQHQDRLGFEFNTFGMPTLLVAEKASSHSSPP